MSLFGPITDAERRGWQLRAARALVDILQQAHAADLPPVRWSVTSGARLVGTIADTSAPQELRRRFDAWATLLDAQVSGWSDPPTGRQHLQAERKGWGKDGLVDVVVLVDIYPEPVEDE